MTVGGVGSRGPEQASARQVIERRYDREPEWLRSGVDYLRCGRGSERSGGPERAGFGATEPRTTQANKQANEEANTRRQGTRGEAESVREETEGASDRVERPSAIAGEHRSDQTPKRPEQPSTRAAEHRCGQAPERLRTRPRMLRCPVLRRSVA